MISSTLSVRDVCERYGVSTDTVLGWIRSGELRAVNVSRRPGSRRPRWRVSATALEAFEALRAVAAIRPRPRRAKRPGDVIEFYR